LSLKLLKSILIVSKFLFLNYTKYYKKLNLYISKIGKLNEILKE